MKTKLTKLAGATKAHKTKKIMNATIITIGMLSLLVAAQALWHHYNQQEDTGE